MSTTPEAKRDDKEAGKIFGKKSLELNTEKSKIMVFRKGQGRRTRLEFKEGRSNRRSERIYIFGIHNEMQQQ